jgi:hypothetical protein
VITSGVDRQDPGHSPHGGRQAARNKQALRRSACSGSRRALLQKHVEYCSKSVSARPSPGLFTSTNSLHGTRRQNERSGLVELDSFVTPCGAEDANTIGTRFRDCPNRAMSGMPQSAASGGPAVLWAQAVTRRYPPLIQSTIRRPYSADASSQAK